MYPQRWYQMCISHRPNWVTSVALYMIDASCGHRYRYHCDACHSAISTDHALPPATLPRAPSTTRETSQRASLLAKRFYYSVRQQYLFFSPPTSLSQDFLVLRPGETWSSSVILYRIRRTVSFRRIRPKRNHCHFRWQPNETLFTAIQCRPTPKYSVQDTTLCMRGISTRGLFDISICQ